MNRRFEMFHYRQVLVRMRQGDSDRDIARSKTMGRRKLALVRETASNRGWLAPDTPLPTDAELAEAFSRDSMVAPLPPQLRVAAGSLARTDRAVARGRHSGHDDSQRP